MVQKVVQFKVDNADYVLAKLYDAGGNIKAKWYVYYSVRNPETGLMERKKIRGLNHIKTLRERRATGNLIRDTINQLLRERWTPFEKKEKETELTLLQHINKQYDLFRNRHDNGSLKKSSLKAYRGIKEALVAWLEKSKYTQIKAQEFTRAHAHGFCDYLIEKKKYTGKSFNARKGYIALYFNALLDREAITINHFTRIKPLPETPARHRPFSASQIAEIDARLIKEHYPFYLFTRFIYYCLLRPLEITQIRIADINTKEWYVVIYGDKAKTRVQRVSDIPDSFRPLITKMKLETFPPDYAVFSKGFLPGSKPISRNRATGLFKELIKDPMKLPVDYTMYAIKHTANARAKDLGIDIRSIQLQNGHATEGQTRAYMRSLGRMPNTEFISKMK